MRHELQVAMAPPMVERFALATDVGPFHGGDATAPPSLALFVGGLTGCYIEQTPGRGNTNRHRLRDGGDRIDADQSSKSAAAPMPPPTHMVVTTYRAPRRRPSINACPTTRLPVMP